MAIQQLVPFTVILQGDGSATTYTLSLFHLFQIGVPLGTIAFNPNVVPASVNLSPPNLGSASINASGDITITLTSAIGAGLTQTVELDLLYNNVNQAQTAAWTSATTANTAISIPLGNQGVVEASMQQSGTVSSGQMNFEVSDDGGTTWYAIQGLRVGFFLQDSFYPFITSTTATWQFSTAGYTNFRIRLNTIVGGTGTVNLRVQASQTPFAVTAMVGQPFGSNLHVSLDDPSNSQTANVLTAGGLPGNNAALYTTTRKLVTYRAVCRLAARPYAISQLFAANTRKQFVTIYHGAAATKTVTLRHVYVALESSSVAAIVMADLIRLTNATTPATGNPAITPQAVNPGDAAAEATVLVLPTTAGTEGAAPTSTEEWNLGITGSSSTTNPPPGLSWVDLLAPAATNGPDFEGKYPQMRSGNAEGWAVTLDVNAASTVKAYVIFEFTEQ